MVNDDGSGLKRRIEYVLMRGAVHNAGFTGYEGEFRKQIARAELQRQFASDAANKLFSELTAGTN